MNSNYEVDILVNDKPIKIYPHNSKLFIEARDGVEYAIRIKNKTYGRIMAVCSVDGLDILNGKKAVEDGPGYVINGYNSNKFEGFRVSDEKVAKFVFNDKEKSYASSKNDGSESNVGVIGIRIFSEKLKQSLSLNLPPKEEHHYHYHYNWPIYPVSGLGGTGTSFPNWYSNSNGTGELRYNGCDMLSRNASYSCNISSLSNVNTSNCSYNIDNSQNTSLDFATDFLRAVGEKKCEFDMGTSFGDAKESKVVEVEFDRGLLSFSTNIYYASRQSLLEMGVPLFVEKQVTFPYPFLKNKYATPPLNWKG